MLGTVIGLIFGAIGGNIAGHIMKSELGTLGRSLIGIVGGVFLAAACRSIPGMGGMFSNPLAGGHLNMASMISNGLSGLAGAALLIYLISLIKKQSL